MDVDLKLKDAVEQKSETFEIFIKKYSNEIEQIRREAEEKYETQLSKQGIHEILLMLWLLEGSDQKALEKFRTLLNMLFKKGVIESLKRLLMIDKNYRKRKR